MVKHKAKVDGNKCLACCGCISVCPQDALSWHCGKAFVDENECIGCSICVKTCPVGAISLEGQCL